MRITSALGLTVGLTGAALWYYAQQRSQKTGRDAASVISNLPAELKQTRAEAEKRIREALGRGRQAAARKEAEIELELRSAESPEPSGRTLSDDYGVEV